MATIYGEQTSHLLGMSNMNVNFLKNGIKPVWVFDGQASHLKSEEAERRRILKAFNKQKKQESLDHGDIQMALKYSKRAIFLSDDEVNSAKQMLKLSGIDYYEAAQEADPVLVYLNKQQIVDYVLSSDSDLLAYGVSNILRKVNTSSQSNDYEIVLLETILKELQFSMEQFLDFCILLGTDYNSNAKGLGPVTAFKMILECRSFPNIQQSSKYKEKFDFSCYNRYEEIRSNFLDISQGRTSFEFIKLQDFSNEQIEIMRHIKSNVFLTNKQQDLKQLAEFYKQKGFGLKRSDNLIQGLSQVV